MPLCWLCEYNAHRTTPIHVTVLTHITCTKQYEPLVGLSWHVHQDIDDAKRERVRQPPKHQPVCQRPNSVKSPCKLHCHSTMHTGNSQWECYTTLLRPSIPYCPTPHSTMLLNHETDRAKRVANTT